MSESSIVDFLAKLDSNNIPYVSWKNNHELSKVLIGKSDIDLFVPIHFKNSFLKMVSSEDWVCLKNKIADFPYIYHYYKVGSNGIIYHIHIYFKIVTGESWIKEYYANAMGGTLETIFVDSNKLYRLENYELFWFMDADDPDMILTQEGTILGESDGETYNYGTATGDNAVTKYWLSKYPSVEVD